MPNRNWSGPRGRITRRKSDLNDDDAYDENTPGCWESKDHASAERALQWVKSQTQIDEDGPYDYAMWARGILRQAPDIVMLCTQSEHATLPA